MSTSDMPQASPTDRRFQVGNRVSFLFGQNRLTGLVVEDRGAIGRGGRHLFRVSASLDTDAPLVVELPADQLQPA